MEKMEKRKGKGKDNIDSIFDFWLKRFLIDWLICWLDEIE